MAAIDELADDLGFGDYDYEDEDEDNDNDDADDIEDDDVEGETTVHDQLPNVEEYRAQMGGHSEQGSLISNICVAGCCFLILTAIIVVVATIVTTQEDLLSASSSINYTNYPWLEGGESERYQEMRRYVTTVRGLSRLDVFEETPIYYSPQYLALQWLAHGDELNMEIPTEPLLEFDERYAMVVLYFSLDGPNWKQQLNFLSNTHICSWHDSLGDRGYGLHRCKQTSASDLYPFTFSLPPNNGLNGTLPDELRGLQRLDYFHLDSNPGVHGVLPDGVRRMVGLTEFVVQYCALSGTLPSWISELTSLQAFGLSGNGNLEGTIPTDMIQQLTNLRLLSLDGNQFRGNIMDLLLLSQPSSLSLNTLTRLHLDDNQLTGSIANAFLSNLPKLRELDVSGNSLEGPLPTNLFHHPVLEVIDLHGNDITGTIPNTTVIVVESVVKLLALQNNGLTGSVPASLSNLIGLKHLDVSSNFLTGSLPSGLGRLAELEYFYVGWNPLLDEAPIPEWMFSSSSWTQLRELSLARSGITGSIPASLFEYLTNLEYLNLYGNQLTGSIPSTIGMLSNLHNLLLKKNSLTGSIPTSLQQLTNLRVVLLEQNDLSDHDITTTTTSPFCNEPDSSSSMVLVLETMTNLETLVMDCKEAKLTCQCCSICCLSADILCNNKIDWQTLRFNASPNWKDGY